MLRQIEMLFAAQPRLIFFDSIDAQEIVFDQAGYLVQSFVLVGFPKMDVPMTVWRALLLEFHRETCCL